MSEAVERIHTIINQQLMGISTESSKDNIRVNHNNRWLSCIYTDHSVIERVVHTPHNYHLPIYCLSREMRVCDKSPNKFKVAAL